MDNSYNDLIEIMRLQGELNNPTPFILGKVKSIEPLRVLVSDIQLQEENLLFANSLYNKEGQLVLKKEDTVIILSNYEKFILMAVVK